MVVQSLFGMFDALFRFFISRTWIGHDGSCGGSLPTLKFIAENAYQLTTYPDILIYTDNELNEKYTDDIYPHSLKGLEIKAMGSNIDYGICFCPNQTSFYLHVNKYFFGAIVGIFWEYQTTDFFKFILPDNNGYSIGSGDDT